MKRVFAMFAILGLLTVPVLVSAEETIIPPEANWTATPPTPPLVATPQKREAALPQAFEGRRPASEAATDDGETIVPSETNWSAVPATPPLVAIPEKREAVTPQAQETVRPTPRRTPAASSFRAFEDSALSRVADDNDE